jgi:hypothetical protein
VPDAIIGERELTAIAIDVPADSAEYLDGPPPKYRSDERVVLAGEGEPSIDVNHLSNPCDSEMTRPDGTPRAMWDIPTMPPPTRLPQER